MILVASASKRVRQQWIERLRCSHSAIEVADQPTLLQSAAVYRPSVILLDNELPELKSVDSIRTIRRLFPDIPIIYFSNNSDDREIIHALKAGASGYCHKNTNGDLLVKAIKVVQKGEIWVGRGIITALVKELSNSTTSQHQNTEHWRHLKEQLSRLTPRELQVAQMVGVGALNKQIAVGMNITERTVKAHLTSIFRKLSLSDRLQLALALSVNHRDHEQPSRPPFLYRTKVQ